MGFSVVLGSMHGFICIFTGLYYHCAVGVGIFLPLYKIMALFPECILSADIKLKPLDFHLPYSPNQT